MTPAGAGLSRSLGPQKNKPPTLQLGAWEGHLSGARYRRTPLFLGMGACGGGERNWGPRSRPDNAEVGAGFRAGPLPGGPRRPFIIPRSVASSPHLPPAIFGEDWLAEISPKYLILLFEAPRFELGTSSRSGW